VAPYTLTLPPTRHADTPPQDDDFDTATRHPFLLSAGQGTLDKDVLERWLRQDYLYAFVGYVKVGPGGGVAFEAQCCSQWEAFRDGCFGYFTWSTGRGSRPSEVEWGVLGCTGMYFTISR
jgi:hypothetical protein